MFYCNQCLWTQGVCVCTGGEGEGEGEGDGEGEGVWSPVLQRAPV